MTAAYHRLIRLIPGLYRSRDALLPGQPLDRLLGILGDELDELADAVAALGDDHFVERASADALPLLAELYGARLLDSDPRVNRSVVARSVAWRRRRGTLAMLEEALRLTTGWSVEVDEAFRSLLQTQDVRNVVPWRGRTAILWDPIAVADPLSRNAPAVERPRPGTTDRFRLAGRAPDEGVDEALRRLGRADAGRHAASPRTLDLNGWSRPDAVVIRTARLTAVELEGIEVGPQVTVPTAVAGRELVGVHLDPLGRDVPLVWLQPLQRPETLPALTAIHEPGPSAPPPRTAATLLTPTALADDPDLVEAGGALEIRLDGIQLLGPSAVPLPRAALAFAPLGPRPVIRFADGGRPAPGDRWAIKLIARQPAGDIVMAAAEAGPGVTSEPVLAERAREELGGATVLLRVRRYGGQGAVREADGTWQGFGDGRRLGPPLGPAAALAPPAGLAVLVRPELHEAANALRLARMVLPASAWEPLAWTGAAPPPEPGSLPVADGAGLLLLVPTRDATANPEAMDLYRVAVAGATATATRLAAATRLRPPARLDSAATVHAGRLYLHGGSIGGAPLSDLWSIAADGSEADWTPHPVRNPQPRRGASLLSTPAGLVLLGGEEQAGALAPSVWLLAAGATRARWTPLPALPFAAGGPGILAARHDGTGLEVLAWADRTRPRRYVLADAALRWDEGPLEEGGPNPPAPGEGVYAGDRFVMAGPAPLPASEVILTVGGASLLAMLPALDLTVAPRTGDERTLADEAGVPAVAATGYASFHLATDGSAWLDDAGSLPLHTRQGGALHASAASRLADNQRLGIPGRLGRRFFRLAQRSLGAWDQPYVLDPFDTVGLDPRLGRMLLPANVQTGRITASFRMGRGGELGAGTLPVDRRPPADWEEPDRPAPVPPDLRRESGPRRERYTAWVDPSRAGLRLGERNSAVGIYGNLEAALLEAGRQPVVGVLRSARLAPARLIAGADGGLSIVAADFGAVPMVESDPAEGVSLAIHPDLGGDAGTDVWLAGLWLAGRLDLGMVRGEVDLRWCTLGNPGAVAVRVAGAGFRGIAGGRVPPEPSLEVRLYGCMAGAIQVPPWVRLVAAGCTFDGSSRSAPAIQAGGADVRLRHCTVHGTVEAGELRASSCAFAGTVQADRADRGWLRHSILPFQGRLPLRYRCIDSRVGLLSVRPGSPYYMVLAGNNGEAALRAGEQGRFPGAHGDRQARLRELAERDRRFPAHRPHSLRPRSVRRGPGTDGRPHQENHVKAYTSRSRFDETRNFTGVFQQMGRVSLDADWNEEVLIRTADARRRSEDLTQGSPDDGFLVSDEHLLDPIAGVAGWSGAGLGPGDLRVIPPSLALDRRDPEGLPRVLRAEGHVRLTRSLPVPLNLGEVALAPDGSFAAAALAFSIRFRRPTNDDDPTAVEFFLQDADGALVGVPAGFGGELPERWYTQRVPVAALAGLDLTRIVAWGVRGLPPRGPDLDRRAPHPGRRAPLRRRAGFRGPGRRRYGGRGRPAPGGRGAHLPGAGRPLQPPT